MSFIILDKELGTSHKTWNQIHSRSNYFDLFYNLLLTKRKNSNFHHFISILPKIMKKCSVWVDSMCVVWFNVNESTHTQVNGLIQWKCQQNKF